MCHPPETASNKIWVQVETLLNLTPGLVIRVIGQDYTVRELTPRMSEAADAIGYCDHDNLEIFLRFDLPQQKIVETLLHELFHCLWTAAHLDEKSDEECQVDRLGRSFACLMRDNPKLFTTLNQALQ